MVRERWTTPANEFTAMQKPIAHCACDAKLSEATVIECECQVDHLSLTMHQSIKSDVFRMG